MANPGVDCRRILVLACGLLPLFAAGCGPSAAPAPAELPPPQVWITPGLVMPTVAAATPSPSAASVLAEQKSEVGTLAEQLFPGRLIERILIPALTLDSPVEPVGWHIIPDLDPGAESVAWDSPDEAVGWMISSGLPDQASNVVLYGHNNMYTSVFRDLDRLSRGDIIYLYTPGRAWEYRVDEVRIFPVLSAGVDQQARYISYMDPEAGPRLTLISCWPPLSNTHRVIAIAEPVGSP